MMVQEIEYYASAIMPRDFAFLMYFWAFLQRILAIDRLYSPAFLGDLNCFYSPNGKNSQSEDIPRIHFAQVYCESREIMDLVALNVCSLHLHKRLFP